MVIKIKQYVERIKESVNDFYRRYRETKFGQSLKKFFDKGDRRFVLCLYLIAFFVFMVTLFSNRMVIAISGDFKLQEIPFYYNGYDDWWTTLTKFEYAMWDDSGFLGQNNIGTNTFYYLWNIFFLPTLLFPRALVPQALAFLIMTKFVLAGFVMKKLLSYFEVSDRNAKLVATAYAFSGWAFYYLWFNHFLEIAVLFPLVLLGTERLFKEKKVGCLILSLFISAMTNYFFFIMFCFCGVIYALFRYFQLWKTYTGKERGLVILLGIASYAISIIMACVILIPAFKVAIQSSRAQTGGSSYSNQLIEGFKAISTALKEKNSSNFWKELKNQFDLIFNFRGSSATKYNMYPIISYFYPPYSCFDSTLIANSGYDNTNCSLFMYTPLTIMLVPSLLQSLKEKKVSHIIGFVGMLIMIFSPFFYYCFTGFTTVCYGRWQLFVVASACIYIAINFDKIKEMKAWYFDVSIVICLFLEILMFVLALKYQGTMGSKTILSSKYVDDRIIYAVLQMMYILVVYIYFRNQFDKPKFNNKIHLAIAIEAIVVGNVLLMGQGTVSYEELYGGIDDVKSSTALIKKIKKSDNTYYRIFNTSADRDSNNLGMVEGYRGLGTFHSMYNYSLDEFAEWSRLTYTTSSKSWRPWSMGYHEKRANLDTFLGVKYYLVNENDNRIAKNTEMLKISSTDYFVVGENNTGIKAITYKELDVNSDEYVIKSISLKSSTKDEDVYTVAFVTRLDEKIETKTYNVTMKNSDVVNVRTGTNGNWYFNDAEVPLKACKKDSTSGTNGYTIKTIQKLDGETNNPSFNLTFTNGASYSYYLNMGEDTNIPFGYKEINRDGINVVYENENFINLGFAFNTLQSSEFVSSTDSYFDSTYSGRVIMNEAAYVRTAILDKEDIDEIVENYPDKFNANITRESSIYRNEDVTNAVKVYNISNNDIKIYLQNWDHDKGIATTYSSPVNYPGSSIKQIYWNSYMDVDLSSYNVAKEAKQRGGAFITVNAHMGENLLITLYGTDELGHEYELNRDIHMKHNYDKSGDWKYERGFYVDDQVTKIRVRAYDTFKENVKFAKPNVTVQYYDDYKNNIDKLKQNQLEEVKVKTNGFSFKTKYDETKMEVLTIPYDAGWSLTRKDNVTGDKENVKFYKAQGGFNSFVAEAGDYSYSMNYETPGLKTGIAGFAVGFTLFAGLYIAMDIIYANKNALKKQLEL